LWPGNRQTGEGEFLLVHGLGRSRLAGGIAHDFNNLLMVILMQVTKIQNSPKRARLLQHAETVRTAAETAASLTKPLLAFGRKQVLVLQVLDLNGLLIEVKGMLSTLQLRIHAFNVLNHPQFGTVSQPYNGEWDTGPTDPNFGTYKLAGPNSPRNVKLNFKLLW
jgi:signal transduction histidine kinase